ncbi:saccharopine dehydrogenase NADP-binding domain-containing protein [Mycobacterium yunnanensis]|uniref:Saccharopine dehydrogenase NADP-binding domain-containing protein n=1 Tax=Mycobacterium yunnanensis TaxID=368477 RepID=A0A9X3C0B3_9MYCO|nr:saccharopine dehydrogenase NADP-binding domain-containing protein [Mycobacterium yunnanensis]MCV7419541.1 saccharopine dehydrogenase NADP-binding domain-containing protein [Mycobacterium yunnanensis]
MKAAVLGATGFTGRLVAAELFRRDVDAVLLGRDEKALSAMDGARDVRVVSLVDPSSLVGALRGCDVVISCVAPFTLLGGPIVEAAIAASCNYVDVTGEQRWVRRVYDEFGPRAAAAGVTLMSAATDDGVPGDLVAGLVAKRLVDVDTLRVHHGMFDAGISRGTMLSFGHMAASPPLAWHDGEWRETDSGAREAVDFPHDGEQPSWALPGPELIMLQRHAAARTIEATMNVDLVAAVSSLDDDVIAAAPAGPSDEERSASRFTILAEARASDGTTARGHVSGSDPYGSTALIAVEAATRLGARGAPVGAVPPSLAFEPVEFLDALTPFGIKWQLGN